MNKLVLYFAMLAIVTLYPMHQHELKPTDPTHDYMCPPKTSPRRLEISPSYRAHPSEPHNARETQLNARAAQLFEARQQWERLSKIKCNDQELDR